MIGIIIVVVLVLVSTLIVVNNQRHQKKQIKQFSDIEVKPRFSDNGKKVELLTQLPDRLKEEFVLEKRLFLINFIRDNNVLFQCVQPLQDPLGLDLDMENDVTIFLNFTESAKQDEFFQEMEVKNSFRKDIVKNEPYYSKNYKYDSTLLLEDISDILTKIYDLNDSDVMEIQYHDQGPIYLKS